MAWLGWKMWRLVPVTGQQSTTTSKVQSWALAPPGNLVVLQLYEDRTYQSWDPVLQQYVTHNYVRTLTPMPYFWRDPEEANWYYEYDRGELLDVPVGLGVEVKVGNDPDALSDDDFYWAYNEALSQDVWDDV